MDAYIEELPETSLCDAEISSDVYDIEPDNGSDRHLLLLCGKSCKKNCSIQDISEALEESPDRITPLVELIKQYPDASTEQIFEKLNEQNVILH